VGKGGVVRDPNVHRRVLMDVLSFAEERGWGVRGLMPSPLRGPKGNVEFLAWLGGGAGALLVSRLVEAALEDVERAGAPKP
jgi:23S rRNA (cytidine1920-2'-O)/16S rRNA (cytidine1409-2'-O)-methyltransferase